MTPLGSDPETIVRDFHLLWYERRQRSTWRATTFAGVSTQQCPFDLWIYQELIAKVRPDTFVEVGIKNGGTTLFLATMCDVVGHGRVVGVDLNLRAQPVVQAHPRVTLIEGDSVTAETFARVQAATEGSAMVLLDSDHNAGHVIKELRLYQQLVPVGSYLIVNDTNIAGHPALPWKEDGPFEAVQEFLAKTDCFEIDTECERYLMTQNPSGYLRRTK